jgi:hypothetical protein
MVLLAYDFCPEKFYLFFKRLLNIYFVQKYHLRVFGEIFVSALTPPFAIIVNFLLKFRLTTSKSIFPELKLCTPNQHFRKPSNRKTFMLE